MLLEKERLSELERSRKGMQNQLNGVVESAKKQKWLSKDPLSSVPLPKVAGLEKKLNKNFSIQRTSSVELRGAPLHSSVDVKNLVAQTKDEVNPIRRKWIMSIHKNTSVAREKCLSLLYAQTTESKRTRRRKQIMIENITPSMRQIMSMQKYSGAESIPIGNEHAYTLSPKKKGLHAAFLEPTGIDYRDESHINIENDSTYWSPLNRAPTMSRAELSSDTRNSVSGIQFDPNMHIEIADLSSASSMDEEVKRFDLVDYLFECGWLYHESDFYFHRQHETHHIRTELSFPSAVDRGAEMLRHASYTRSLESIAQLKSWVVAQVFLNDEELAAQLFAPRNIPTVLLQGNNAMAEDAKKTHNSIMLEDKENKTNSVGMPHLVNLSARAPTVMHQRAAEFLENLVESRASFAKAAGRSLRSVLNPGGWLTIRPITALNLPDSYTGMFVKLRYGSTIRVSETADAKVTPTWTVDDDIPFAPRENHLKEQPSGKGQSKVPMYTSEAEREEMNDFHGTGIFKSRNDLDLYVEPLKTSGSVRLSVVGERLQSNVELGVLQINLASAISCCAEQTSDKEEIAPAYIRWFPLMSPKACIPIEGDMGLSTRAPESEKTSDHLFSQYFAPCIKLALYWQPDHPSAETNLTNTQRSATANPLTQTYFQGYADSLSVALIDSMRATELLSFCSTDHDIRYSVTNSKTRVGFAIGWVQLDHQVKKAREPVVLAPTPVTNPQPTFQLLAEKDNLKSKTNIDSFEYIALELQEIDFRVEEVWIFDVWEFILRVRRRREAKMKVRCRVAKKDEERRLPESRLFATDNAFILHENKKNELSEILDIDEESITATQSDRQPGKKIYIKQLLLGFVKVNLSYIKSSKGPWESPYSSSPDFIMRNRDDNTKSPSTTGDSGWSYYDQSEDRMVRQAAQRGKDIFRRWSEDSGEELWTGDVDRLGHHNLPHLISAMFPAITDAPVRLQGKILMHVFETQSEIAASLKDYYGNETLRQIYKIIGSLDFVGNPTMVFNSFITGVRDFFVQPSREFIRSPTDPSRLGIGVAKGILSLVSHSASGIFGFASKMSATAGQAAATLSMDDHYKRWHTDQVTSLSMGYRKKWRSGLKIVVTGVTRPVEDILIGMVFAATGMLVEPYRGLRKGGTIGLAKGLGIGTIGLVFKPLVGFFDALTHFTESVHDLAQSVNILEKKLQPVQKLRLPYVFGVKKLLTPFNPVDARSMDLLHRYPSSVKDALNKKDSDSWGEVLVLSEVLHMEPGIDMYVVLTTKRVVLFRLKIEGRGASVPSLIWEFELNNDFDVTSRLESRGHNGVVLHLTRQVNVHEDINDIYSEQKGLKSNKKTTVNEKGVVGNQARKSPLKSDRSSFSVGSFIDDDAADSMIDMLPYQNYLDAASKQMRTTAKVIAQQAGTIIPRGPIQKSYQSKNGKVFERFVVLGEFQHRSELARMHNALCCLMGHFNSIIYEGNIGFEGSTEGYTSFGHLHFENNKFDERKENGSGNFYSSLENIAWLHDDDVSPLHNTYKYGLSRRTWLFSDEMASSKSEGGPDWLVAARARAMFVPMALPPLPTGVSLQTEMVHSISSDLSQGLITYREASEAIKNHAEIVQKGLSTQQDFGIASEDDNRPLPSILTKVSQLSDKSVAWAESISGISYKEVRSDMDHSDINERLEKVVGIVEKLVSNLAHDRAASPLLSSCSETVGASTSLANTKTVGGKNDKYHASETERLRMEVEELRNKLAETEHFIGKKSKGKSRKKNWIRKMKSSKKEEDRRKY